jgi:hypothetical protein
MPDYSNSDNWTEAEKAQWILENQWDSSAITYIYERVGDTVYRRPIEIEVLPPWMSKDREACIQFHETEDPDFSGPNIVVTDSEDTAKEIFEAMFGETADK